MDSDLLSITTIVQAAIVRFSTPPKLRSRNGTLSEVKRRVKSETLTKTAAWHQTATHLSQSEHIRLGARRRVHGRALALGGLCGGATYCHLIEALARGGEALIGGGVPVRRIEITGNRRSKRGRFGTGAAGADVAVRVGIAVVLSLFLGKSGDPTRLSVRGLRIAAVVGPGFVLGAGLRFVVLIKGGC